MNLSMKGRLHLANGTAEVDGQPIRTDRIHMEALAGEPAGYGVHIRLRRTVLGADLGRGQPLVIVRRVGIVLAGNELLEGRLALGAAAEIVAGCW